MTRRNLYLKLLGALGIAQVSHAKPATASRKLHITLNKETFEALDAITFPGLRIGGSKKAKIEEFVFDRARAVLSWVGPWGMTDMQITLQDAYRHYWWEVVPTKELHRNSPQLRLRSWPAQQMYFNACSHALRNARTYHSGRLR